MGPLTGTGSLVLCLEERERVTQWRRLGARLHQWAGETPLPPSTQTRVPSLVWPWTHLPSGYQWLAVPEQLWVLSGEMESCPLLGKEQLTRPGAPALSPHPPAA